MKFFETSDDIKDLVMAKFEETGLAQMGINLKIMSVTKAKSILKAMKAGATMQYLTNKDAFLIIYEEAFDRLDDVSKVKLIEGCLSNVMYDTEKDKLNVETDIAKEIFRMRRKYENYVDVLETSYMVISQIEDEEKQRKEDEKARKAEAKAMKNKR